MLLVGFVVGFLACLAGSWYDNRAARRRMHRLSRMEFLEGLRSLTDDWADAQPSEDGVVRNALIHGIPSNELAGGNR